MTTTGAQLIVSRSKKGGPALGATPLPRASALRSAETAIKLDLKPETTATLLITMDAAKTVRPSRLDGNALGAPQLQKTPALESAETALSSGLKAEMMAISLLMTAAVTHERKSRGGSDSKTI